MVSSGLRTASHAHAAPAPAPARETPYLSSSSLVGMLDGAMVLAQFKDGRRSARRCQEAAAVRGLTAAPGP